eukprot:scpid91980/ scgid34055/ 
MSNFTKPENLEIGDHVYVPRSLRVFGAPETYIYCHHGIVAEVNGKKVVIGFGTKVDEAATESFKHVGKLVRTAVIKLATAAANVLYSAEIKQEEISSFVHKGRVYLYTYDTKAEGDEVYLEGCNPDHMVNAKHAAEIAKVFLDCQLSDQPFGAYNLEKWNCECFATFCKTNHRPIEEIRKAVQALGVSESVDKSFLLEKSKARTLQIERLKERGFDVGKQLEEAVFGDDDGMDIPGASGDKPSKKESSTGKDAAAGDTSNDGIVIMLALVVLITCLFYQFYKQ